MNDSENSLSHRNSAYYSIGIPVVLKLKLPPQQHKLKYQSAKVMQIYNRYLFKFFMKSIMFLPRRLHSRML